MSRENNSKKRPLVRGLAMVLALALLCTVVVTQFDEISRLASVIAEDDPLSRIYSILQGEIADPQTFDDYYQLASIAIGKGEYEVALEHLGKCAELADESDVAAMADLWLRTASVYVLMQRYDDALTSVESVLSYDSASADALLIRAQIELEREEYLPAARDLESYLELLPEDTSALSTLAQVYEILGRYQNASECYDRLYALAPGDDTHRLNALRCLFRAEDFAGALAGFDAYLADEEEATVVGSEEAGDAEPGTDASAAPVEQDSLKATAYFLRAACKMQTSDYAGAVADFETARARGYDAALCLEQVFNCRYAMEDYEAAFACGEEILALQSANVQTDALCQRMGAAAMTLERYEDAVDYMTRAIEINPALQGSYYYRGVSLQSLERYEEAVADFTASIEQEYLPQYCYYNRGVCYVQLLEYDKALDDMELTLTTGDEQMLKDAATNVLWQLAQYYENQRLNQQIEAGQIVEGDEAGESELAE